MTLEGKKSSRERDQTDQSLRTERANIDRALADRQAASEQEADSAVDRARENADAVLGAARDKADERREQSTRSELAPAEVIEERGQEDAALRQERALADESLRQSRLEMAQALAKLLPLERAKTDRYLLTERARSDDALSHRDDFLSIVSHDLRNLLSGIVMSAALLAESAPQDEQGKKTVAGTDRIQRYAARMNRLIGDLVDVASIDAGKLSVTTLPGDAHSLVVEVVETFQAVAADKQIRIEKDLDGGELLATFDHDRMLQVLANLVTNAVKFSSPGATIRVRAERDESGLRFSVNDTGLGIAEHLLEVIFERFWQVGKNDRRGIGLGLYISRCIVAAHGGTIWAESQLGEGSQFYFTLPSALPSSLSSPQPSAVASS